MPETSDLPSLLRARYGDAAPVVSDPSLVDSEVLALLLRHRSVRRFTDLEVSDDVVTALVAAAQAASSSSNNQTWSVVAVRDPERLQRLATEAGGSAFIPHAPLVLLFVADWARAATIASWQDAPAEAADYLESTLVSFVDAGIAAQNAVVAAEALGFGTCYLGSLRNRPEVTAEIVGLPDRAVVAFGVAIGWPDPSDTAGIKPRLGPDVVRSDETYAPVTREGAAAYEAALDAYNATQGRGTSWISAVVARVRDIAGLHGRESIRTSLERRGLPSR